MSNEGFRILDVSALPKMLDDAIEILRQTDRKNLEGFVIFTVSDIGNDATHAEGVMGGSVRATLDIFHSIFKRLIANPLLAPALVEIIVAHLATINDLNDALEDDPDAESGPASESKLH
jgi:hypothetical protein